MGAQESANKRHEEILDVDDEVPHVAAAYKLWSHIHSGLRNKRIACTIFIKNNENDEEALKYFENGIKLLKQLKHPNILKFLEGACTVNDVTLITERAHMLDLSLKSMSIVEIQSGLRHILEALLFLHNNASLSHNNVSPSSVFVCDSGEWKLGGFEFTSSPSLSRAFTKSNFCSVARMKEFIPPEEQGLGSVTGESPFANDSFGFGKLIEYVFQNFDEGDEVVSSLKDVAAKLTVPDPAARLSLFELLDHPSLSNDLTQLISFCNTIQMREEEERNAFYASIVARLRCLPGDVVARRLCRLLLSRYLLLEPKSHSDLYPYLLVPIEDGEGILSRVIYDVHMIPELVRLFRVRETAVRIALLSQFHRFAYYIPRERLRGFIADEVVQGCRDSDSNLVSSSLRALATLVDILGAEAVCPWPTTKKFGNGSPQKGRTSRNLLGVGIPRMYLANSGENEKSCGMPISVLNDSLNNEKEWMEEGKTNWFNDISWSTDWKDADEPAPAKLPDPAPPSDEKKAFKTSNPMKLHTCISKKESPSDHKKANAIGSEFEISVLPKKSFEDDLFADLTPNIPTPTSLIEKLKVLQTTAHSASPFSKVSPKFAMVETPEDTVSWDENEDIGLVSAVDGFSSVRTRGSA